MKYPYGISIISTVIVRSFDIPIISLSYYNIYSYLYLH